jgi:hypothetical protein
MSLTQATKRKRKHSIHHPNPLLFSGSSEGCMLCLGAIIPQQTSVDFVGPTATSSLITASQLPFEELSLPNSIGMYGNCGSGQYGDSSSYFLGPVEGKSKPRHSVSSKWSQDST